MENRATLVQAALDQVGENADRLTRALAVMVCDRRIRAFLLLNDQRSLEQAAKALDWAGFCFPSGYDVDDEAILNGAEV